MGNVSSQVRRFSLDRDMWKFCVYLYQRNAFSQVRRFSHDRECENVVYTKHSQILIGPRLFNVCEEDPYKIFIWYFHVKIERGRDPFPQYCQPLKFIGSHGIKSIMYKEYNIERSSTKYELAKTHNHEYRLNNSG